MTTYILSLETQEIRAIAQMLHMRKLESPESKSIDSAFEKLREQTNIMMKDPRHHRVFPDPLLAPQNAMKFNGQFYVPEL